MPFHLGAFLFRTAVVLESIFGLGGRLWAQDANRGVTVEKKPVKIERRTFDPKNPPSDMPEIKSSESGLCWARFSCESRVGVEGPSVRTRGEDTTITSVTVRVGLEIIIWTIVNASPRLVAHEEAHRVIAEHYYGDADEIAQRLAEKLLGQRLSLAVDNSPEMKRTLGKLQQGLLADFLYETGKRCNYAQERFDVITNHGVFPVPEGEAIDRALTAEERAKWR